MSRGAEERFRAVWPRRRRPVGEMGRAACTGKSESPVNFVLVFWDERTDRFRLEKKITKRRS
ncbi:MAG: hypothetical protein WBW85_09795, partial [Terriglobales bacterium]